MVQDFTKVGMPSEQAQASDPLTAAVRSGIPTHSDQSGVGLAVGKFTGAVPMGIDAPTKRLRKAIGGAWELLALLKFGFGALLFLFVGVVCCYFGVRPRFELSLFAIGIGSLVLSALSARWALHVLRNLRAIAKA